MAKARTPRAPKPKAENTEKVEKKVLQMPEASAGSGSNGTNGNGSRPSPELQAEIRRRAYEIYAARGYADGLHEQDWLEAEIEVLSRNAQKHSA
jgi:hypothetical protein